MRPDPASGPALNVWERRAFPIVHHTDARGTWATAGRKILFRAADAQPGAPWQVVARWPRSPALDWASHIRPACRALRADRCNVYPTRSGLLLGIRGSRVFRLEPDHAVEIGRIKGDCLMNRSIAETADGSLLFGEYFTNPERVPVKLWRIDPALERCEVTYAFDRPRPRHVHGVHLDPYTPGRIWVTMGDFDDECFVACSDDDCATLEFLGDGSQTFRCVGLLFFEDRLGWLTDSHISTNRVVSLERASGRIDLHGEVQSSSWYLARTTEGTCLATTTVEPGPGIHTNEARLLQSRDGLDWHAVQAFVKDPLSMRFFKFGSLALPSGQLSARAFWLSGQAVRGLDGASIHCGLTNVAK